MPTYVNTIIYKIICKDQTINDIYIGHTTNLKSRIIEHKYNCSNENSKSHNIKLYLTIRELGGWTNWEVIKIEDYPCNTKKEAEIREHFWYFTLNATLNTISPILDIEKKIQNKEKKSAEAKELTLLNQKQKKEERLKYLEENKEAIKLRNIELRKKRDEANRDKINLKMREYNQKTKERRAELGKIYYEKRKQNGYYLKKTDE